MVDKEYTKDIGTPFRWTRLYRTWYFTDFYIR